MASSFSPVCLTNAYQTSSSISDIAEWRKVLAKRRRKIQHWPMVFFSIGASQGRKKKKKNSRTIFAPPLQQKTHSSVLRIIIECNYKQERKGKKPPNCYLEDLLREQIQLLLTDLINQVRSLFSFVQNNSQICAMADLRRTIIILMAIACFVDVIGVIHCHVNHPGEVSWYAYRTSYSIIFPIGKSN